MGGMMSMSITMSSPTTMLSAPLRQQKHDEDERPTHSPHSSARPLDAAEKKEILIVVTQRSELMQQYNAWSGGRIRVHGTCLRFRYVGVTNQHANRQSSASQF
jgi:hypothetical protein